MKNNVLNYVKEKCLMIYRNLVPVKVKTAG